VPGNYQNSWCSTYIHFIYCSVKLTLEEASGCLVYKDYPFDAFDGLFN
jgi:hypothetical protein